MGNLVNALKAGHAVNKNGYFNSYRENIFGGQMNEVFQDEFDEGSGGELHSKAEAVHSSSMLSYNFFHWIDNSHPFVWDGVTYTQVSFEVKMKTIKGSNAPANMDVVLIDKDKKHLLFIESKFTEYTETKEFKLSDSYKVKNNNKNDKWLNQYVAWDKVVDYEPKEHKYKEGIKQLITHLFGIHNQFIERCDRFKDIDFNSVQMKFITLIYEPSKEKFVEEHNAYEDYSKLFTGFVTHIKDVEGLNVVPEWVSYSKLWKEMKGQMPEDLKIYLWERYMKFAQEYIEEN